MDIPRLHPDLTFPKLKANSADMDFAFEAKRAAMGPHITQKWGWDEAFQRDVHARRYQEKPFFQLRKAEQPFGTVSFQVFPDHVRFGEFYMFPEFQRQGTGSRILQHCLQLADSLSLPVRLEYLIWNPVGSLYRRFGFLDVGRSDIHCFMERPPGK